MPNCSPGPTCPGRTRPGPLIAGPANCSGSRDPGLEPSAPCRFGCFNPRRLVGPDQGVHYPVRQLLTYPGAGRSFRQGVHLPGGYYQNAPHPRALVAAKVLFIGGSSARRPAAAGRKARAVKVNKGSQPAARTTSEAARDTPPACADARGPGPYAPIPSHFCCPILLWESDVDDQAAPRCTRH